MLASERFLVRASLGVDVSSFLKNDDHDLRRLKALVPSAVENVGRKKWEFFTSQGGEREGSTKIISRAYFKLREIMLSCAIAQPRRSVHLCEAPGGFIQYLGDLCGTDWEWTAVSISTGAAFETDKLRMLHGKCLEMDVLNVESACSLLDKSEADLVTADGAWSPDHTNLEGDQYDLIVAETKVALHCLRQGGTMIIKFFEGIELMTLEWIARVSNLFTFTSIIKPFSSRSANSERYLVARGYTGCEWDDEGHPSGVWLDQARAVTELMCTEQANALSLALKRAGVLT
jgi:23S rRNA U2552 (ribose-2'-O)-methylase RlmE/FtsJ